MTANAILMALRPQGKVMVVFPVCEGRDGVRFEPEGRYIEDQFQRDAWRFPGRFYVLGAEGSDITDWQCLRWHPSLGLRGRASFG